MPSRRSRKGKWAYKYCKGFGLEIGALHTPFDLNAKVLYLDRFCQNALMASYVGDKRASKVKNVDLVAANVPYDFLCDGVFDFVASSHVLEHMANPGLALEEWMRITVPGGRVYGIIPNKNECFDRPRETTRVEVLLDAYESRERQIPFERYKNYFEKREIGEGERRKSPAEIKKSFEIQDSIHVYTYTPESFLEFLEQLAQRLSANIEFFLADGVDIHFVLKKNGVEKGLRGARRFFGAMQFMKLWS